jgi:hypothetical protein
MKPAKPIKPKRCKAPDCGKMFTPSRPLQVCCYSISCAFSYAKMTGEKKKAKDATAARKAHRAAVIKSKPLKWYEDKAQRAVNAYVVHGRDKDDPCISCGTTNPNIIYAAGHFRTRGAASQHRYNLDNLHKQCNFHCNSQLSGNIQNYRPALILKIGQERYDALMNDNESRRYTVEELLCIESTYKNKLKALKCES